MRIGFFTDDYFPRKDGVTYTVKAWKKELERQGHEVYVIYPSSGNYSPDENEVPIRSVPNPFYHGHSFPLPATTRTLPELDVVHAHSPGPLGILSRYYAWKKDVASFYTHHTPLEDYIQPLLGSKILSRPLEKLFVKLETAFMKTFDTVTSNTERNGREMEALELPVGIDTEFFKPSKESFLADEELEEPVIGYSGRISEEKNLEKLLDLAGVFGGTVLIVGEGRHRKELEEEAPDNVIFYDFLPREKLPEFYSGIDVFVTASLSDTLSLTTLEANACGTPVAAPDAHPFDQTIGDQNGVRYSFGDLEDMLAAVERCAENDFSPREAAYSYSVKKTVDKLEKLYKGKSD